MKHCSTKHWLIGTVVVVAILFLLAYAFQWQAILSFAPFLLLLLCPLMHLFMMGDHGHNQRHRKTSGSSKESSSCH